MKHAIHTTALVAALISGAGCGTLFPKPVEFGQSKVQPFPEHPRKLDEQTRQVAWRAAEVAKEIHLGAVRENVSTNLTGKTVDVETLTGAVSDSLGPPRSIPSPGVTAKELADRLEYQIAKFADTLAEYKEDIRPLEGKKVEGTGWLSVPYFVYILGIVVVGYVLFTVSKVALSIASVANPAAGLGVTALNLTGSLAGKMLRQVATGGERFKSAIQGLNLDDKLKEVVLHTFQTAHKSAQDEDTQNVVSKLTNKG